MKIMHVIIGLQGGGAEGVLFRLCTSDRQNVHTVVSLTGGGIYAERLRVSGISVIELHMRKNPWLLQEAGKLYSIINQEKPDLIQTWMYHADLFGGITGWLSRTPVIWGIRHSTLERGYRDPTWWVARLCAVLSKHIPHRIIACAQKAKEVHAAMGYDAPRMVVIPNGYDMTAFRPNPMYREKIRKTWGISDSSFLVGMVARLHPQKNHVGLLDALEILHQRQIPFSCALVGRGMQTDHPFWEEVRRRHLSDAVIPCGERSDIVDVINALDLHVLSSLGEGFPNVVAEAMACQIPCVVTDVGDASWIVGDTGWVVPPGKAHALADAIQYAIEEKHQDPQHWEMRKMRARQRILENFSLEIMVQQFQQVWAEVVMETQKMTTNR